MTSVSNQVPNNSPKSVMPSSTATVVAVSVIADTNPGGRLYMEDYIAVYLSPKESLLSNPDMREQAFVGVFDGHGGKEAAKYARDHLWSVIQDQSKFLMQDPQSVREAISNAYLQLHNTMQESRASWVPNKYGDLSTAGTTASTVIFRKNHIYVANVGDSTGIMGVRNPRFGEPGEPLIIPKVLTKDHKPEDPEEQDNTRRLGGEIAFSRKGIMRVVWERERVKSNGQKQIDRLPFLGVTRSLGDFWSYSTQSGEYTVSPVPYVYNFPLDLNEQKFIVLASDGLWNVMTPSDVVNFISDFDNKGISGISSSSDANFQIDVVSALIQEALNRYGCKKLQADNIAVIIAYLSEDKEELGPNKSAVSPKYHHRRNKKKKNKKLSEHKTLLPTISDPLPLQPMSDIHDALHCPPVESCIDPSTTGIMDEEEYAGHLEKRSKEEGAAADDEGEGFSLPGMKKFKENL